MRQLILRFCVIVIALAGCSLKSGAPANVSSAVNGQNIRLDAVRESPPEASGDATSTPKSSLSQADGEQTPYRCDADEKRPARQISADVQVDYASKAIEVSQQIIFVNREEIALGEIILDVQVNQWVGSFRLAELTVNNVSIAYDLVLNRLSFAMAEALKPGCWLEIGLNFSLQPEEIRAGVRSYRGFFGYSPRQLNLAHFLPTVAARVAGEWRIHEPLGIGEQLILDVADWDVTLKVRNAADSFRLAAPGRVSSLSEKSWRIQLENSRDFALSLSEEFVVTEELISEDLIVAVYTFADAETNSSGIQLDGAKHVLQEAARAFDLFGRRFGPYPYDRFVIVQGDFPDGMEFTGLVFVGSAWFYGYDGTPNNYLTLIALHEIAHQWWYARLGNDSALYPWLDEAFATYSEYLYFEEYYPAERNWWWTFRVAGFAPQGKVDSGVYEFSSAREYINAIYLRGAQMLHNLREDIGDVAFFELVQDYQRAGAGRIADPALFWRQLQPQQGSLTLETRREFLSDPGVNGLFLDQSSEDVTSVANAVEEESP